ncbi:contractile injection system tape measure protein [Photorhabdus luminescens]|uniref:contractile injection system tape measure protein n=1 Tax=Photorhabdus luminescens TaxID=29488 RepID=UPI00223EB015|nr:contractile injection system tape measure protein [Photorhabdus luminescens]MCW7760558.1 contractile injection system tape measure protein [Photorhabdus luminescens subsp. venezuelensis]
MTSEPNLLNRIVITIEANNHRVANKVLHGSLLNQANINSLFNTFFTQHPINQDIYLETLTLNLGEISLHNFNSVFPRQLNIALSKALNQYQINHQEKISLNEPIPNKVIHSPILFGDYSSINAEEFIHTLYQKDSTLNQMEAIINSKNSDIKHLTNQIIQIKSKLALLLAKSCLSEPSLKRLLTIKQPTLLSAINYRLSERANRPQYREEFISSGQLILNALGYMQRHNTQEIPKLDVKVISRITTELNNSRLNATPIIELFHQIITHQIPLNSWLKQLWQTIPVSQLCKKHLSVNEYSYLSEYFISDKLNKNRSDAESASDNTFIKGVNNNNPRQTINLPNSKTVLLPKSCQVNNAGILILWPMLPALFNQLGLLEEQKFTHRQAQFSAVNFLDYLIWETEETPTEQKVLNNVLCGLMADENSESISIEPEKQLIIDQWLSAVINQLPGWKKLSCNDVRQLFLQRPGELLINEQEINITVENQPFDVLLTDWPWPLNIAKFPWLDRPLRINWQNI